MRAAQFAIITVACLLLTIANISPVLAASTVGSTSQEAPRGALQEAAGLGASNAITQLAQENVVIPGENKQAAIQAVIDLAVLLEENQARIGPDQMSAIAQGSTYGGLRYLQGVPNQEIANTGVTVIPTNATYNIVYGSAFGAAVATSLVSLHATQTPVSYGTIPLDRIVEATHGGALGGTISIAQRPDLVDDVQTTPLWQYLHEATSGATYGVIMAAYMNMVNPNAEYPGTIAGGYALRLAAEGATRGVLDGTIQRMQENRPPSLREVYDSSAGAAKWAITLAVAQGSTDEQIFQTAYDGGMYAIIHSDQISVAKPANRFLGEHSNQYTTITEGVHQRPITA